MSLLKKLQTIPAISKFLLNRYAPYRGAGIEIDKVDLANYHIRIKMPLTRKNQNVVGVHFGGSLYSMVDPLYMLILMHHLGSKYIVWDKSASIQFLSPGRGTVYANIRLDSTEIDQIKRLAENHAPVYRNYHINIFDESGVRIAEVEKTIYIRRKKPKASHN
jgi:acyl-coenzyme A thioesterase PaaI-like protein